MSGESQHCRICGLHYVMGSPNDSAQHREMHAEILRGGLPTQIRAMLKSAGHVTIGGHSIGLRQFENEYGKQAVIFSWWARARTRGIPDSELNSFFSAHFELLDAEESGDEQRVAAAREGIRPWEEYAG